jgi:siroheme synthase
VFGRGGEEAEVLAEAGVPFEIVPGVTSAVGACAAVGIPLTHRNAGQAVALVTGHHDPDSPDCTLDWGALARLPGVVFYMGVRHIAKIAARLSGSGLSPNTPAAVIESGTLPAQRVLVSDLSEIRSIAENAAISGPAVFVVGEVVRYRSKNLTPQPPSLRGKGEKEVSSVLSPSPPGGGVGEGSSVCEGATA